MICNRCGKVNDDRLRRTAGRVRIPVLRSGTRFGTDGPVLRLVRTRDNTRRSGLCVLRRSRRSGRGLLPLLRPYSDSRCGHLPELQYGGASAPPADIRLYGTESPAGNGSTARLRTVSGGCSAAGLCSPTERLCSPASCLRRALPLWRLSSRCAEKQGSRWSAGHFPGRTGCPQFLLRIYKQGDCTVGSNHCGLFAVLSGAASAGGVRHGHLGICGGDTDPHRPHRGGWSWCPLTAIISGKKG